MKTNSLLVLALTSLGLSACNDFRGTLSVPQNLAYTQDASRSVQSNCRRRPTRPECVGLASNGQYVRTLPAGSYDAKLKFPNRQEMELELKLGGRNTVSIEFDIPRGTQIPEREGSLALSAAQTRQPFDTLGRVHTEETNTNLERGSESCSFTIAYQECRVVPTPDGKSRREYTTQYDTISGDQNVEFYYHTSTRYADVVLSQAGAPNVVLGTFRGSDSSTNKVYTYQGQCYPSYSYDQYPRRRYRDGCGDYRDNDGHGWHGGGDRDDRDRGGWGNRGGDGRGGRDGGRGNGDNRGDNNRGGGNNDRNDNNGNNNGQGGAAPGQNGDNQGNPGDNIGLGRR